MATTDSIFVIVIHHEKAQGTQKSQQPTGSQIIRICVEIYLKIDKMIKMYKNSY